MYVINKIKDKFEMKDQFNKNKECYFKLTESKNE